MSKAIIIGSGIGGLASSIRLAVLGYDVEVHEASSDYGGKAGVLQLGAYRFDTGPSLFTLPGILEELFEFAGRSLSDYLEYERLDPITNYFFANGKRLSASADPEKLARQFQQELNEPAKNVRTYLKRSARLYDLTEEIFLRSSLHDLSTYKKASSWKTLSSLHRLQTWKSMHKSHTEQFKKPESVQLFDRYATYNGSDPYRAPATLNVIPHLEYNLGAFAVKGGIRVIVDAMYKLASELSVQFHFNSWVDEILLQGNRVSGIRKKDQLIDADLVVSNADIEITYRKLLPNQKAPERILKQPKSSSALVFFWGIKKDFRELDVHNIFFSTDYKKEFSALANGELSDDKTVYVNITSKVDEQDAPRGSENWFVMVNAPQDKGQDWDSILQRSRQQIINKLNRHLAVDLNDLIEEESVLSPTDIEAKTGSYGGALYGPSSNNMMAAFLRHPNFSRKVESLYFCGGSVHPGGGIPLCLLSAKIVGDSVSKRENILV
jgi:phytoene desaturase